VRASLRAVPVAQGRGYLSDLYAAMNGRSFTGDYFVQRRAITEARQGFRATESAVVLTRSAYGYAQAAGARKNLFLAFRGLPSPAADCHVPGGTES